MIHNSGNWKAFPTEQAWRFQSLLTAQLLSAYAAVECTRMRWDDKAVASCERNIVG